MNTENKEQQLNRFFNDYLTETDNTPPTEGIDYNKPYKISGPTGGSWKETINISGFPKLENGEIVGGIIEGTVSYSGTGGTTTKKIEGEVTLERWKAYVNNSIRTEQEKASKEAERLKNILDNRKREKYKNEDPLNYFLDEYLTETDNTPPTEGIDYNKPYKISGPTGGSWKETINISGFPKLENGEIVGGIVEGTVSYSGAGGATTKKIAGEVTLERWKAYVNNSIRKKHEQQKQNSANIGKYNTSIER